MPPSSSRPRKRNRRASTAASLLVITGLSGSGKGTTLRALEDQGYYCVDHLPITLIPTFADLVARGSDEGQRAALVVDIREGGALEDLPALFEQLRQRQRAILVFVEASEEALLRRFSETRRPHPLGAELTLREGIQRERRLLKPIRAAADIILDTTRFSPHELRRFVSERFAVRERRRPLLVSVVSFGYRYGLPPDADLVFDARCLPNPNFVPALKPLTGQHRRVARYVLSFPQSRQFIRRVGALVAYLLPHYEREGKSYLTVAIGCTGGRHRSVALAGAVARRLRTGGRRVKITHRDVYKAS
ncbi:MAG: RNase adapter RapZ [Candidatus Acidiferrales bacterium]